MRLVEFTVYWHRSYSAEDKEVYSINHGDNMDNWPPSDNYSNILLDIDSIMAVNPSNYKDKTVVSLCGGGYIICMEYEELKIILKKLGLSIESYAVQDINK